MPDTHNASDEQPARSFLGGTLFLIYAVLYSGFVLLNAFAADLMDTVVWLGLNLAIVYGFGLILAAILMALIYGYALRNEGQSS